MQNSPLTASMPQTLELQEFLHGRFMFWLLLTCITPDNQNQGFIGKKRNKEISAGNINRGFLFYKYSPQPNSVFGSVGNSFDMLEQYCDSQSQWRHCMLVPLKGVINVTTFQMESENGRVLLLSKQ